MGDHRMAGVGLVLDQHLPVAVVHVAQHAACHFELSDRRAVDHVVEARQRLAEELLEAQADVVQLAEDEAAIVVHVAYRRHAARGMAVGEAGAVISRLQGNAGQAAVEAEGPGVIGAAKEAPDIAAGLAGQPRALCAGSDCAGLLRCILGVAHHDDGLRADRRGVVSRRSSAPGSRGQHRSRCWRRDAPSRARTAPGRDRDRDGPRSRARARRWPAGCRGIC